MLSTNKLLHICVFSAIVICRNFCDSYFAVHGSKKVKSIKQKLSSISGPCSPSDDLKYHGYGSNISEVILQGKVNLYNIYIGYSDNDYKNPYKEQKDTSTAGIIEAFGSSVSRSAYVKIMQTYSGAIPTSEYKFVGNYFYNIDPKITVLTDVTMDDFASKAISEAKWPIQQQAIYSVIFRGDISYTSRRAGDASWNKDWCGYHYVFSTIPSMSKIPISIMGDENFASASVRAGCMIQYVNTQSANYVSDVHPKVFSPPNKNVYGDAVVSIYAHEMVEVASDIKQYGWFKDCDGGPENADLCAWTFDRVYQSSDGSHYNIQLGNNKFLIQANWVLRSGTGTGVSGCVLNSSSTPQVYSKYLDDSSSLSMDSIIGYSVAGALGFTLIMFIIYHFCFPVQKTPKVTSLGTYDQNTRFQSGRQSQPSYEPYDPNRYNPDTYRFPGSAVTNSVNRVQTSNDMYDIYSNNMSALYEDNFVGDRRTDNINHSNERDNELRNSGYVRNPIRTSGVVLTNDSGNVSQQNGETDRETIKIYRSYVTNDAIKPTVSPGMEYTGDDEHYRSSSDRQTTDSSQSNKVQSRPLHPSSRNSLQQYEHEELV